MVALPLSASGPGTPQKWLDWVDWLDEGPVLLIKTAPRRLRR